MLEKLNGLAKVVKSKEELAAEFHNIAERSKVEKKENIAQTLDTYNNLKTPAGVRAKMKQGYIDMATINFSIACECTYVETEAENKSIRMLGG